jgi:predicted transposase/invertase (TIGR01784 family)
LFEQTDFAERMTFYENRLVNSQIKQGEKYEVIEPLISIIITDFLLDKNIPAFHNNSKLCDPETGFRYFANVLAVHTLELPKVSHEDHSALGTWARLFTADTKEELDMLAEQNPQVRKSVDYLKKFSQTDEARLAALHYDKIESVRLGREKFVENSGLEKGRQEGREEGRQEGRQEGRELGKLEMVKALLANNVALEIIANVSNLSLDEVKRIQQEK